MELAPRKSKAWLAGAEGPEVLCCFGHLICGRQFTSVGRASNKVHMTHERLQWTSCIAPARCLHRTVQAYDDAPSRLPSNVDVEENLLAHSWCRSCCNLHRCGCVLRAGFCQYTSNCCMLHPGSAVMYVFSMVYLAMRLWPPSLSRWLLTTVATLALPGILRALSAAPLEGLENRFDVWIACGLQNGRLER